MKRIFTVIMLTLFTAFTAITAGGCDNRLENKSPAIIPPDVSEQPLEAFGIVKPLYVKDIVIEIPALIEAIYVKKGQKVKKGDALAEINGSGKIICDMENGSVSEIFVLPGAYAGAGASLLRISDFDSLIVEANVDEQFITRVKLGADAFIIPDADREHTYWGKVTFIASEAVQSYGETSVPVQITVDEPDGFLLPNFNVEVRIEQK